MIGHSDTTIVICPVVQLGWQNTKSNSISIAGVAVDRGERDLGIQKSVSKEVVYIYFFMLLCVCVFSSRVE